MKIQKNYMSYVKLQNSYLSTGGYPGGPDIAFFINTLSEYNKMYLDLQFDMNSEYYQQLFHKYRFYLREFFDSDSIEMKLS